MANTEVIERVDTSTKVQIPKMFKVILHNDDKTTFEFVIAILVEVFHHKIESAIELTKTIHEAGQGIAGVYTKEIAAEKIDETRLYARANGFPLVASMEEN